MARQPGSRAPKDVVRISCLPSSSSCRTPASIGRVRTSSSDASNPGVPVQCFKIPCRRENHWTRIVADSEELATFAYVTTDCLETDAVKCRGLDASWANSTASFWTAISCCEDGLASPKCFKVTGRVEAEAFRGVPDWEA